MGFLVPSFLVFRDDNEWEKYKKEQEKFILFQAITLLICVLSIAFILIIYMVKDLYY